MKVAFVIPCRNKEEFVGKAIQSAFHQTYNPLEIILSDQKSQDNSYEIIKTLAADYSGPHTICVLECPHADYRGMAGLNAHLSWIHRHTEADVMIMCSADDYSHPERTACVMEAFERYNPDYVGNCTLYLEEDGTHAGEMPYKGNDCRVGTLDILESTFGGACAAAWKREFYLKHEPKGIESADVLLPAMASLENGFYYLEKTLHTYIKHKNAHNTGCEGKIGAAKNDEERLQYEQLQNFHYISNMYAIAHKIRDGGYTISPKIHEKMCQKILDVSGWMTGQLNEMTLKRIRPVIMEV